MPAGSPLPNPRSRAPVESLADGGDEIGGQIDGELLLQFARPGRTRDVDFGDEAADHVEADEQHAARREFRADLRGEEAIAFVELAADARAAGGEIAR